MIQKPSFASLLVAGPSQLKPFHTQSSLVGVPSAPPSSIKFGSSPPGVAQSSRFTGGVVQKQSAGQMFSPPNFVAPTYPTLGVSPLLAALLGSPPPGLSPMLPPPRPPGTTPTPRPPGTTPYTPPGSSPPPVNHNPSGAPGSGGGYSPLPPPVLNPGLTPTPPSVVPWLPPGTSTGKRGVYQA